MRHTPASARTEGAQSLAELVMAAQRGEGWAQEELFMRHAAMVNRFGFRLLGGDQDLDDLVQDSFIQALVALRKLRHPEAFVSWLRAIVYKTALRVMRRRRLMTRLLRQGDHGCDIDGLVSPTASPEVVLELRSVYRIVRQLPAPLGLTLILRRVEGLRLEEVAELTGSSLATVKRRLAKVARILGEPQAEETVS